MIHSDHDNEHYVMLCNAADPDNPSICFLMEIKELISSGLAVFQSDGRCFNFNKISQVCHPKQQVPDGKWTRKPLAYRESNNFLIYV